MKSIAFAIPSLLVFAATCPAAIIKQGDIVTPQATRPGTILVIDPSTGNREILSQSPSIGHGPAFVSPKSITMLPNHNFLVTDAESHAALTLVNSQTGDRTDIATATIGTGPLGDPMFVFLQSFNTGILLSGGSGGGAGFVTRVDLTTGNRTLVSGMGLGSGPALSYPSGAGGAFLDARGHLVVGDYMQSTIFDVNLSTGNRAILSGGGRGSGPALDKIIDIVGLSDGSLIVSESNYDTYVSSLVRIDPSTGNRTLISTGGYPDYEYSRIALGADGDLLGSVASIGAIFSIDPATGARDLTSGNGLGTGPKLFWGDIVVVPEPHAGILFLLGTGIFAVRYRRAATRADKSLLRRRY